MIQSIQGTYVCGDGSCDINLGESVEICPKDCKAGVEYDVPEVTTETQTPSDTSPSMQTYMKQDADLNPWITLAGILMMLTLFIPLIYWRRKTRVLWRLFAIGALLWTINMIIKAALDQVLTPLLVGLLPTVLLAIMFGARTGIFEVLLPFGIIKIWRRLKEANWKEAVAFGIGYGGFENFMIGLYSSGSTLLFNLAPQLLERLPDHIREEYLSVLTSSTWFIFAPALERTAALFGHIAATVLIFAAVRLDKWRYLLYAFVLKASVDTMALYLQKVPSNISFLLFAYLVEIPIIIYGIIGVWVIKKIKKKYPV